MKNKRRKGESETSAGWPPYLHGWLKWLSPPFLPPSSLPSFHSKHYFQLQSAATQLTENFTHSLFSPFPIVSLPSKNLLLGFSSLHFPYRVTLFTSFKLSLPRATEVVKIKIVVKQLHRCCPSPFSTMDMDLKIKLPPPTMLSTKYQLTILSFKIKTSR